MALFLQPRPQVELHQCPPSKRRKRRHQYLEQNGQALNDDSLLHEELSLPVDDILANHQLFAISNVDDPRTSPTVTASGPVWVSSPGTHSIPLHHENNPLYTTAFHDSSQILTSNLVLPHGREPSVSGQVDPWLTQYTYIEPALPNRDQRVVRLDLDNPFLDHANNRLPHLKPAIAPQNGEVNGYVKFRLRRADIQPDDELQQKSKPPFNCVVDESNGSVTRFQLPRDFGMGCKLDNVDRKLFQFYRVAWCSGRTILPQTNCWLVDLGPMLAGNEILRHALLSLSSTYVLDYLPDDGLRKRANSHYERAATLLTEALNDPSEQDVGKGDALVGAITIFNMLDVVTWEVRRNKHLVPRWLEGARLACKILDSTDPGYRYYKPKNVQASAARVSNTIIVGRAAILVLAVLPLDISHTSDNKFGWLLHGTESEARKIHGGCGFSPKLLHFFAQITHFAATMQQDNDSPITPVFAENLEKRLANLHQWSEISPGCVSLQELFDTCVLNAEGVVDCPIKMTELTGEAWRVAAQIYLQCRVFRFPRSHQKVVRLVGQLADIISRMPCSGPLFTAQAPFMPVFLLGLVSTEPQHRDVAKRWFETVINASSCRSIKLLFSPEAVQLLIYVEQSVPPAWEALQRLQEWIELNIDPYDDHQVDDRPYGHREPWWELVVEHIRNTEGTLCLI